VREHAELWLADYNREIPHDSLGGLTPAEFRMQNGQRVTAIRSEGKALPFHCAWVIGRN
jgi:hypothetical protein